MLQEHIPGNLDVFNMNRASWWQVSLFLLFLLTIDVINSEHTLTLNPERNQASRPYEASEALVASNIHNPEPGLSKRVSKYMGALGPGWVGHIVYSDAIYPYRIGAQILGKFYQSIMYSASGIWRRNTRPMNTYAMSIGTIILWIWSDNPLARILWDFVYDLASRMFTATQLGFVGLFDGSFVHLASGVMVHVKLQILGRPSSS